MRTPHTSHTLTSLLTVVGLVAASVQAAAQCPQDVLARDMPADGDSFGAEIATDADLAVIGSPGANSGQGVATVFRRTPAMRWVAEAEITNTFPSALQGIGESLAVQGDAIAVGITQPDAGFTPPFVSLVLDDAGTWTASTFVSDGTGDVSSDFGAAVAFGGDELFVGAPDALDATGTLRTGAVYRFLRDAGDPSTPADDVWNPNGVVRPPVASQQGGMRFGESLDVDGDRLAVGAPRFAKLQLPFALSDTGIAYVYDLSVSSSVPEASLTGYEEQGERFATSVAISGDRLAAGAPWASTSPGFPIPPSLTGRAYTFARNGAGNWLLDTAFFEPPISAISRYGLDVDLRDDVLVVGSPTAGPPTGGADAGHAYVYLEVDGQWNRIRDHQVPGFGFQNEYGTSVALTGELATGDLVLVGAPGQEEFVGGLRHGRVEYRGTMLEGCDTELDPDAGGTYTMTLSMGPGHAGEVYSVNGSVTGTSPGIVLGGHNVPLVVDSYWLAKKPNGPIFDGFLGVLDADGNATATLTLVNKPELSGLQLFHAFSLLTVTLTPLTITVDDASHAVALQLL